MSQHGKGEELLKLPKSAWTTKASTEKSRRHLGLETTITSRGQITVPHRLMKEFDLRLGDTVRFQWLSESKGKLRVLATISREEERIATLRIFVRLRVKPKIARRIPS